MDERTDRQMTYDRRFVVPRKHMEIPSEKSFREFRTARGARSMELAGNASD